MPIYELDGVGPTIDPTAYVHVDAILIGNVVVKAGASVWPGAVLRGDDGVITIGENTSVQDGCVVHVTSVDATTVGRDCVVGHAVHLEGCTIGDRTMIGSGSVVLNGAVVGNDSLIAAGAVVGPRTRIPDGVMARGVPARIAEGVRVPTEMIAGGVQSYLDRSARYRRGLKRIDAPPDAPAPDEGSVRTDAGTRPDC